MLLSDNPTCPSVCAHLLGCRVARRASAKAGAAAQVVQANVHARVPVRTFPSPARRNLNRAHSLACTPYHAGESDGVTPAVPAPTAATNVGGDPQSGTCEKQVRDFRSPAHAIGVVDVRKRRDLSFCGLRCAFHIRHVRGARGPAGGGARNPIWPFAGRSPVHRHDGHWHLG